MSRRIDTVVEFLGQSADVRCHNRQTDRQRPYHGDRRLRIEHHSCDNSATDWVQTPECADQWPQEPDDSVATSPFDSWITLPGESIAVVDMTTI